MSLSTYFSCPVGSFVIGIVFDKNNNLYMAYNINNTSIISKVDTSGKQTQFASGFSYIENLIFDNIGFPKGYLYVMDSTNTIYKVDVNGIKTIFIKNLKSHYCGMVFDNIGNLYYSSNQSASVFINNTDIIIQKPGRIYKIDKSGTQTMFINGENILLYPAGLTFDNKGNLYISDLSTKNISKYDSNGTLINKSFISTQNNDLANINLIIDNNNNNIYVVISNYQDVILTSSISSIFGAITMINKYDFNGNLITTIYRQNLYNSFLGLAFDNIGNLYIANSNIIKYTLIASDPVSNPVSIITPVPILNTCQKKGFYPSFTPVIYNLSVTTSQVGQYSLVYITGSNFVAGSVYVNFGLNTYIPVTYYSSFNISFVVPITNIIPGSYIVKVVNVYNGNFSPSINISNPGIPNYSNPITYVIT